MFFFWLACISLSSPHASYITFSEEWERHGRPLPAVLHECLARSPWKTRSELSRRLSARWNKKLFHWICLMRFVSVFFGDGLISAHFHFSVCARLYSKATATLISITWGNWLSTLICSASIFVSSSPASISQKHYFVSLTAVSQLRRVNSLETFAWLSATQPESMDRNAEKPT